MELLNESAGSPEVLQIDDDDDRRHRSRSRSRSRSAWPTGKLLKQALEARCDQVEAKRDLEEVALSSVKEEVARLDLPIFVSLLSEGPQEFIMSLMSRGHIESFYIGATVDPVRRWRGGNVRPLAKVEEAMPGHCHQWITMYLIAIATNQIGSTAGRVLETQLIKFAKAEWPSSCKNVAEDARGQCMGINFMYMVVHDAL